MTAPEWSFVICAGVFVACVVGALVWCLVDIVKGMFR